jgi:membrane associated rhomboid family serine protease
MVRMDPQPPQPSQPPQPPRPPIVTGLLIGICVVIYAAYQVDPAGADDLFARLGVYFFSFAVWDGAYSSLLGAAFLHLNLLHLFFNVFLLWAFGRRIEQTLGPQALFGVAFFSAIVGSATQLALGDWPCIGASGVVYALFGLMLGARDRVPLFARELTPQLIRAMIGWLLLCIPIDYLGVLPIGNGAHVAGFILGYAAAWVLIRRRRVLPAGAALAVLAALSVASLTWMPWDATWRTWRTIKDQYGPPTMLAGSSYLAEAFSTPEELNDSAWSMAASPRAAERNGPRAVELARAACALTHWGDATIVDTLAAAFAETGQWREALITQQLAVAQVEKLPDNFLGVDPRQIEAVQSLKTDLRDHLEAIRRRAKIRDPQLAMPVGNATVQDE